MQPAVFIARLAGPLLVVIGVGVLLNEANYAAMITEGAHSPTLIYLSGLLTLPLGIAILNFCRAWTAGWRVIVTILGWLLAIGGAIRIVLPQFTATLATTLYATSAGLPIFAVVMLVLGGYLTFEGYRSPG
jgi:hypothetical protein